MTSADPRPDGRAAPRYGEYATPEEVAALVEAAPPAAPASAPAGVAAGSAVPGSRRGARRYDRPITIALLVLGVINLVQYASPLLDFATALDRSLTGSPYDAVDFGEPARIGGLVLLAVWTALVVGSVVGSYLLLRRGRVAFWVPLAAGALTVAAWVAVLTVIVLQTPDALSGPGR